MGVHAFAGTVELVETRWSCPESGHYTGDADKRDQDDTPKRVAHSVDGRDEQDCSREIAG